MIEESETDASDRVLTDAAALGSRSVRTLEAVHLATALYVDADELVAYDRRLLDAAQSQGLSTASPGCGSIADRRSLADARGGDSFSAHAQGPESLCSIAVGLT